MLTCVHTAFASNYYDSVEINYNGAVVLPPCTIDSSLLNINLGDDINVTDLATTGSASANWSQGKVVLSDCAEVNSYTVTATLDPSPANPQYIASTGTAEHIAVEGLITVGLEPEKPLVNGFTYTKTLGAATSDSLLFKFRLHNDGTGAATTGTVVSTVTINYTFN